MATNVDLWLSCIGRFTLELEVDLKTSVVSIMIPSSKIVFKNSEYLANSPSSSMRMQCTVFPYLYVVRINQRTTKIGNRFDLVGKARRGRA